MVEKPNALSDSEIEQFVELGQRMLATSDGRYPYEVFSVLKHFFPLVACELVVFRIHDGSLSVLLFERKNDIVWSIGEYFHSAGMMVTKNIRSMDEMLKQIQSKELGGARFSGEPFLFHNPWRMNTRNGPQVLLSYAVVVDATTTVEGGEFYPIDNLPLLINQNVLLLLYFARYFRGNNNLDGRLEGQVDTAIEILEAQANVLGIL